MPVRWDELEEGAVRAASQWPLAAALERVAREGDAWSDIARAAGPLPRDVGT
jgi:DNA primase